ncbi:MAG TPA: hypothetical protein VGJ86_09145 [Acidimicrobiales bacterium]|jgi:orotate phosphoribosyltransferase
MTTTADPTGELERLVRRGLREFDSPRSFGLLGQFTCRYFVDFLDAVHREPFLIAATGVASRLFSPAVLDGAVSVVGPKNGNAVLCNALARTLALPSASVRDYPLVGRYIEGVFEPGRRSVVFDDVSSDGEILADVVRHLRAAGARVDHAVVVVNRLEGDAREVLADLDVELVSGLDVGDDELAALRE